MFYLKPLIKFDTSEGLILKLSLNGISGNLMNLLKDFLK